MEENKVKVRDAIRSCCWKWRRIGCIFLEDELVVDLVVVVDVQIEAPHPKIKELILSDHC